jgi:hypothetical protein
LYCYNYEVENKFPVRCIHMRPLLGTISLSLYNYIPLQPSLVKYLPPRGFWGVFIVHNVRTMLQYISQYHKKCKLKDNCELCTTPYHSTSLKCFKEILIENMGNLWFPFRKAVLITCEMEGERELHSFKSILILLLVIRKGNRIPGVNVYLCHLKFCLTYHAFKHITKLYSETNFYKFQII